MSFFGDIYEAAEGVVSGGIDYVTGTFKEAAAWTQRQFEQGPQPVRYNYDAMPPRIGDIPVQSTNQQTPAQTGFRTGLEALGNGQNLALIGGIAAGVGLAVYLATR